MDTEREVKGRYKVQAETEKVSVSAEVKAGANIRELCKNTLQKYKNKKNEMVGENKNQKRERRLGLPEKG